MNEQVVACASGDGIGPEIMGAVQRVLEAAGAPLEWRNKVARVWGRKPSPMP